MDPGASRGSRMKTDRMKTDRIKPDRRKLKLHRGGKMSLAVRWMR
jgi:hypothetical protein